VATPDERDEKHSDPTAPPYTYSSMCPVLETGVRRTIRLLRTVFPLSLCPRRTLGTFLAFPHLHSPCNRYPFAARAQTHTPYF
jgi:hypothetical protein